MRFLMLLLISSLQIPTLRAFDFMGSRPSIPDLPSFPTGNKNKDKGSNPKSPFGDMVDMMDGFDMAAFGGDWMKGLSFGKFIIDALNLFLSKGLFFTGSSEREKTPFAYSPSDSAGNKNQPKSKKGKFDLAMNSDGDSLETIISIFEYVISDSPHRAHPFYLKREAAGLDAYAVIGDILSVTVTTAILISGKGYHVEIEIAVLTFWYIIQRLLVHQIRILIGYPYGDGAMTVGECMANMEAVTLALAVKCPLFSKNGFQPLPMMTGGDNSTGYPVILISEGNRESLRIIFGLFTGIPEKYQVKVKMDESGRMDPTDLELKIKEAKKAGLNPFMVIAQIGSTTLGAVDPIEAIVQITEKYDLWLHIDGTHGGPCLFSNEIKEKWKGVERSNSFAFSFGSLLGVPYPASFIITRNDGILNSLFNMQKLFTFIATHIGPHFFQSPKFTDAGKTWLMWFIKGHRGLRQHVEYSFNLTKITREKIKSRPNFELLTSEVDTPVIPFRVIPTHLKTTDVKELDKFTAELKMRLLLQGLIYISVKRRMPHEAKHFMFPLSNSILTEPDIIYVLDTIDCHAKNIAANKNGPCTNIMSKRVNKMSPLAMGVDGYAPYVNALMPDLHLPFFQGIFELFLSGGKNSKDPANAVLDLGLSEAGMKQKDIMPYFKDFMGFWTTFASGNNKSAGPFDTIFNMQAAFQSMDKCMVVSLMADLLTTFMCPSMESKESSPPFVEVKDEMEKYIRTKVGYPGGKGNAVTVAPDGSSITIYTIGLAKYQKLKNGKEPSDKALVMFISAEAHFTWKKAAASTGIGFDNCKYVSVNKETGAMDVEALRTGIKETVAEGKEPFLIVGTLGTEVLGSVDNFKEIGEICKEHNLWFHVDGRFGGPLILSDQQTTRTSGIEKSDSFSFSPTRFFPGESNKFAVLVTRHEDIFSDMFRKDKNSTTGDTDDDDEEDSSSAGSRSSDEFKFWLALKSEGAIKTAERIEKILQNVQTGIKTMKASKSFTLILTTFELTSICFVYKPNQYKDDDGPEVLDGIQLQLELILKEKRLSMVYYTNSTAYEGGKYGFLKIDVANEKEDLNKIISKIEQYGKDMDVKSATAVRKERIEASNNEENTYSTTTTTTTTVTTTTLTKTTKRTTTSETSEVTSESNKKEAKKRSALQGREKRQVRKSTRA